MATTNNINFYSGEAIQLNFTMNPVVSVAGWTITLTIKNDIHDATPLLSVSPATIDGGGVGGAFHFALTHAQTAALSEGTFVYDVQRVDVGGEAVLSIGSMYVSMHC